MFYESNSILNMNNKKLKKIITTSIYSGYRLGDIVKSYPCKKELYLKKCYLPQKKKIS